LPVRTTAGEVKRLASPQADVHNRLLRYTADAVRAFMEGHRADRSRRRRGGDDVHRARPASRRERRTDLDRPGLKMTTDFRRVDATMIKEWLGSDDPDLVLKGRFEPRGAFA
jgi:hypothetical protein